MLNYDNEVGDFTVGLTVTGGTSGASGTIFKVEDAGTTGTLTVVKDSVILFQDGEQITDTATGDALVDETEMALVSGIVGVDPSTFSFVWTFANRLFFVEKMPPSAFQASAFGAL